MFVPVLTPLKSAGISVVAAVCVFSLGFVAHLMLNNVYSGGTAEISSVFTSGLDVASVSRPRLLIIPAINVDAPIEQVGLTSEWAMDTPKQHTDAAWFDLGPRPGERGSAVIAGHYGWKDGLPAAFDNLHSLQVGDKIYIEDDTGATTTFVVKALRKYGEHEAADDVFGSRDGQAHLNLITCGGVWNRVTKSYSQRLVVFTDREYKPR